MAVSVEIIEFTRPASKSKNLYISGIVTNEPNEAAVMARLYDACSPLGLVYEIQVFPGAKSFKMPSSMGDNSVAYYAFVKFYSYNSALKAKAWLARNLSFDSNPCKVQFATRTKEETAGHPLFAGKCQEMANYYLGFNGWTTAVLRLEPDTQEVGSYGEEGEAAQPSLPCANRLEPANALKVRFFCVMELSFPTRGLKTQGFGAWEESYSATDPSSKSTAVLKARKRSQQRALEAAFSRVLLVVVSSDGGGGNLKVADKVSVEIDTTKPDQLSQQQMETMAMEQVLTVNELGERPPCDDHVSDLPDTTQDADDVNLHILQELGDELS